MMADDFEFSLIGLDSVLKNMGYVSDVVAGKKARSALRKAANIIVAAGQQNASRIDDPETKNDIELNVASRFNGRLYKRTGDIGFRVGVMGGARKGNSGKPPPGGDTWYWRLLEFGTKTSIAKPFLRPALTDNISQVTNTFITELDKALASAIKRGKTL